MPRVSVRNRRYGGRKIYTFRDKVRTWSKSCLRKITVTNSHDEGYPPLPLLLRAGGTAV